MCKKPDISCRCVALLLIAALFSGCVRQQMVPMRPKRCAQSVCDKSYLEWYGATAEREYTYEEVICRVLEKNLEAHVKELDVRIQYELATRENLRMLPHLEIDYQARRRSNNPGSASESLVPGVPPAPPSVSTERRLELWNHRFAWNLIDFGVAYFVTRQATNRAAVVAMEYERLRQKLIKDATEQYWMAISAKRAIEGATVILEKVDKQQTAVEKYIEAKVLPQRTGLENKGTLLDVRFILQGYQLRYKEAMQNLAEIMGVFPGEKFSLKMPTIGEGEIELNPMARMEDLALLNRPELFGKDLDVKIRADEVRAAILRMVPGLELFVGHDYDSNRFLVNSQWISLGIHVLWDLFNVPGYYQESKVARGRKFREQVDRLKVSMSVLTQLHLSYIRFLEQREQLGIVKERSEVKRKIVDAAQKEFLYGEFKIFEYLQYERQALAAEIQYYETYGRMMVALEEMNNAMGLPCYYTIQEGYE